MKGVLLRKGIILIIIFLLGNFCVVLNVLPKNIDSDKVDTIGIGIGNSPPTPPIDTSNTIVETKNLQLSNSEVILFNVPTSKWTYGCGPTAAGMIMGYYDRAGFPNMYFGQCNNGVCPLTNLGQGTKNKTPDYPINKSCHIIATEKGLDGIIENGHVDDYWISYGSDGPDPWENNWHEHTWNLCLADFMGTNQWKWDRDGDGKNDANLDKSTRVRWNTDGSKLYDPNIPVSWGIPRTSAGHGIKLFAESRGYTVVEIYNQLTDTSYGNGGFTYNDFKNEIDMGHPIFSYWETSSGGGHFMVGVGYNDSTKEIYIHDTWDNNLHKVNWNGVYSGYHLKAVTVLKLQGGTNSPMVKILQPSDDSEVSGNISILGTSEDADGMIIRVEVKIDNNDWQVASGSESWNITCDTTKESEGIHTIYAQSIDNKYAYSPEESIKVIVNNNEPPSNPICSFNSMKNELAISATDSDDDMIRYGISWTNDMTVDQWTDFVKSGTEQRVECIGAQNIVGVIAEDEHGAQSEWISVKSKHKSFINYLENHLNLFPLLRQLLVL